MTTRPLADYGSDMAKLREALQRAEFTVDGVTALLPAMAADALGREQVVPALLATGGGTPLETLMRLFLLGATEYRAAVETALHPLTLNSSLAQALLEAVDGGLRARLEIRPYGDEATSWWVLSDLGTDVRAGALANDHVLGIGGASVTLAEWTVRPQVDSALDVGTGCGVQSLHLSRHAARVTATDRNPRALLLASMTAQLNELNWELLEGDLLEPVAGRRFDLIVSNPPFVVGPATRDYIYRDSGLAGDAVSEHLVRQAPGLLADGGWCQLLTNWVHVRGQDWSRRVVGWGLARSGCDVWVVQREVQDPAEYVEMWLRDSGQADGPAYRQRYAEWLAWFAAHDIEGVGFGVVTLHRSGRSSPAVEVRSLTQQVERPIGRQVLEWFARQDRLRDVDILNARLIRAPSLRLEQTRAAGPAGWALTEQWLRMGGGLGDRVLIDDDIVGLIVAGATGDVTLRQQLEVIAAAYEIDVAALAEASARVVVQYVTSGLLDINP